jgi:hypothetical protein
VVAPLGLARASLAPVPALAVVSDPTAFKRRHR